MKPLPQLILAKRKTGSAAVQQTVNGELMDVVLGAVVFVLQLEIIQGGKFGLLGQKFLSERVNSLQTTWRDVRFKGLNFDSIQMGVLHKNVEKA